MNKFTITLLCLVGIVLAIWYSVSQSQQNNQFTKDKEIKEEKMEQESNIDLDGVVVATLETNMGNIYVQLFPNKAKNTVTNFINLANKGFYDGTKFHRIINDFMIQGGDPLTKDDSQKDLWGTGGPNYKFEDEINDVSLVKGVIAMANSGPNTNGSQFFIVTAEATPWLDGAHTAFGQVVSGMEVVEQIEGIATDEADRPINPVIVNKVRVENQQAN